MSSLGYTWNYDTKLMMACYAIPLSKFIPKDFETSNKTDLANVFYIDLNSGAGLYICSSSNQHRKINLFSDESHEDLKKPCKVDFCGKTLQIALYYKPPMTEYIMKTGNISDVAIMERITDIKIVSGFEVQFLKSLAKHFNFKIMLMNLGKGESISQQFKKGTVDLLANFLIIDHGYHIGYTASTYPLLHHETYCLVLHRSYLPQRIINLFEIFEYPVYLLLVAVSIVVSVMWLLILKLLAKLSVGNLPISSIVMDVISIVFRESISRKMHFYQERILIATFLLYILVIMSIFDGNLINMYNKLDTNPPFKNLQQFLTSNKSVLPSNTEVEMGLDKEAWEFANFDRKTVILENFTNIRGQFLIVQNYKKFLRQGYAILSFLAEARQKFVENSKDGDATDFVILTDILKDLRKKKGIIVSKRLRFLSRINRYITRLREGRITYLWCQSWNSEFRNRIKMSNKSKGFHDLALSEMQVPFICLGFGVLCSCIVLLLEIFGSKCRKFITIKSKMLYTLVKLKNNKK
ncbi:hypothetical protein TSAR_008541 [Trichomalopsis sarcophagae]|uniref:Uncharacterized protein n=1 Tax=Trichomalopsis sarcophagae TaxID=543379 RepID=A0A232FAD3_9HYME|nr:hypothetical protein TSAR_008541 [Trichomalopsis sarcophagae]